MTPAGEGQKRKAEGETGQMPKRAAGQAPHLQAGYSLAPPPGYGYGPPPEGTSIGHPPHMYPPGPRPPPGGAQHPAAGKG